MITEFKEQYKDFFITDGVITVEKRPHYCDRGRFIVKVFSRNPVKLYIDGADGFPRYYFNWDCLVKEMESWTKSMKQEFRNE